MHKLDEQDFWEKCPLPKLFHKIVKLHKLMTMAKWKSVQKQNRVLPPKQHEVGFSFKIDLNKQLKNERF